MRRTILTLRRRQRITDRIAGLPSGDFTSELSHADESQSVQLFRDAALGLREAIKRRQSVGASRDPREIPGDKEADD